MPKRRSPTLGEALEDWLTVRSAGRGLSPNTLRAYRRDIAAFAERLADEVDDDELPAVDRVHVAELTSDAVVTALAALQHDGAAPATRARIHGTLAALCAHLVRHGDLRVDPMAESGLERPKQPRSLPRYIERDTEIARVLRMAATPDPDGRNVWPERDIALAALLAGTGIRASELCGLRIRDLVLDVEDPYLRVTGKGGAVRDCPLLPEVATTLEDYIASRNERTKRRAGREAPVWLNGRGKPLTPSALDHHVRRWYDRAKVPLPEGAAAHAFRHTVAMQLVNRGEPVNVMQALLGHASLSSTQIYIRAAGHHVREAAHTLPVRQQLRKLHADPGPPNASPRGF
jgi:integrase/recombinase XerC